jgi:predicted metal-dependent enzyme (double-stranded beta helix superfamily)
MMSRHQLMMSDMQAMDKKLDELVARMNATRDEKTKLDAVAAVVTELVSQRRQMRGRMADMQSQMMGHMMGHMQEGPASAMQCPMMQQMMKPEPPK